MSVVKQIAGGCRSHGAAARPDLGSGAGRIHRDAHRAGGDVVASGSGTMDLIGLSYQFSTEFYPTYARVFPEAGDIGTARWVHILWTFMPACQDHRCSGLGPEQSSPMAVESRYF